MYQGIGVVVLDLPERDIPDVEFGGSKGGGLYATACATSRTSPRFNVGVQVTQSLQYL